MSTVVIDVPSAKLRYEVPLDSELYLHFKEDVTFCNNNRDAFVPNLPCNIYFKAGDAWGPAVPVPDKDGLSVTYGWIHGHGSCGSCEPAGPKDDPDDGGHIIHVGG